MALKVVVNGKRVQELREEQGWSKRELAEAAGINRDTVARVEREETVRVRTAQKVGAALGVNYRSMTQVYWTPDEVAGLRANVLPHVQEEALKENYNERSIA